MKLTRIIHPIGQGGFYTETFSEGEQTINIVYDCGGFGNTWHNDFSYRNRNSDMNKYLESYVEYIKGTKRKTIDAIFISHFHVDHINGLQFLLDNDDITVDYLIIPQLTDDVFFEALMYSDIYMSEDRIYNELFEGKTSQFLFDLYNSRNSSYKSTKIIQIEERDVDDNVEPFSPKDYNDNSFSFLAPKIISNNSNIYRSGSVFSCAKWLYVPFNSKVKKSNTIPPLSDKLKSAMKDDLKSAIKEDIRSMQKSFIWFFEDDNYPFHLETDFETDFERHFEKHFEYHYDKNLPKIIQKIGVDKCKETYESIFGNNHNHYCMTLFSGTMSLHTINNRQMYSKGQDLIPDNPNCLYTGDFAPANNIDALKIFYGPIWETIRSIQIPHHGSSKNCCDELYKHPIRGFISVGNNNTFKHPGIDTLMKMKDNNCEPIIVTEDKSSMKIYQYELV